MRLLLFIGGLSFFFGMGLASWKVERKFEFERSFAVPLGQEGSFQRARELKTWLPFGEQNQVLKREEAPTRLLFLSELKEPLGLIVDSEMLFVPLSENQTQILWRSTSNTILISVIRGYFEKYDAVLKQKFDSAVDRLQFK